jgi:hypothetical protein
MRCCAGGMPSCRSTSPFMSNTCRMSVYVLVPMFRLSGWDRIGLFWCKSPVVAYRAGGVDVQCEHFAGEGSHSALVLAITLFPIAYTLHEMQQQYLDRHMAYRICIVPVLALSVQPSRSFVVALVIAVVKRTRPREVLLFAVCCV